LGDNGQISHNFLKILLEIPQENKIYDTVLLTKKVEGAQLRMNLKKTLQDFLFQF